MRFEAEDVAVNSAVIMIIITHVLRYFLTQIQINDVSNGKNNYNVVICLKKPVFIQSIMARILAVGLH